MTSDAPPTNRHRTTLQLGELTLTGVSTGGVATSLAVPELGVAWDVGAATAPTIRCSTLLLTHAHADHMGALHAWLGIRLLYRMPAARIVAPHWVADDVRTLITTWERLQGHPYDVRVVDARPGEPIPLRRHLTVVPFKAAHVVPTLGYAVVRRKTKLRPAFLDLPGPEIARLRREGTEGMFDEVEEPLIAYTGDTLPDVIDRELLVRTVRVLLIECTFLDDRKPRDAIRAGGHIHVDDLIARAALLENEQLVLLHFSQLYTAAEVRGLAASRLPADLLARTRLFVGTDGPLEDP